MTLRVTLAAMLADHIGGQQKLEVAGETAGEVLRNLSQDYPALSTLLWKPDGEFNPMLVVFLGNDDIRHLKGLETPLHSGQELTIISAIEGG